MPSATRNPTWTCSFFLSPQLMFVSYSQLLKGPYCNLPSRHPGHYLTLFHPGSRCFPLLRWSPCYSKPAKPPPAPATLWHHASIYLVRFQTQCLMSKCFQTPRYKGCSFCLICPYYLIINSLLFHIPCIYLNYTVFGTMVKSFSNYFLLCISILTFIWFAFFFLEVSFKEISLNFHEVHFFIFFFCGLHLLCSKKIMANPNFQIFSFFKNFYHLQL